MENEKLHVSPQNDQPLCIRISNALFHQFPNFVDEFPFGACVLGYLS